MAMKLLRKSFRGKKSGESKLIDAALNNDEALLVSLLAFPKTDPNASRPGDGCTALHAACNGGFLKCVEHLLDRGADASKLFAGWNALQIAAAAGHDQCITLLMRYPVNKLLVDNGNEDPDERTALHLGVAEGHIAVVESLLSFGADPNKMDRGGNTALHLAIMGDKNREMMTRVLLESERCFVDAINTQHQTPLMMACIAGSPNLLDLLLEYGADTTLSNDQRRTALDIAQQQKKQDCIMKLLDASKSRLIRVRAKAIDNKHAPVVLEVTTVASLSEGQAPKACQDGNQTRKSSLVAEDAENAIGKEHLAADIEQIKHIEMEQYTELKHDRIQQLRAEIPSTSPPNQECSRLSYLESELRISKDELASLKAECDGLRHKLQDFQTSDSCNQVQLLEMQIVQERTMHEDTKCKLAQALEKIDELTNDSLLIIMKERRKGLS